jgi:hypothetical protein
MKNTNRKSETVLVEAIELLHNCKLWRKQSTQLNNRDDNEEIV